MNVTPDTLQDQIRLARIQVFFRNAVGFQIGAMVAGGLSALVFARSGTPMPMVLLWLGSILSVSVVAVLFERHVRRVGVTAANYRRYFVIRAALGGANGTLFGASLALLPAQASSVEYVFVFVVLASIVALVYMAFAAVFAYGLMLNMLTLLPYTGFSFYQYFTQHDSFMLLMAAFSIVWQVVFMGKAHQLSRLAVREIEGKQLLQREMEERRRAEDALVVSRREAEQLASMLRMMCDNVPDMIWAKDLQGRFLFANQALCERLLGVRDAAVPVGKTFAEFVADERKSHAERPDWFTYGEHSDDVDLHTLERDEPTVFEESGTIRGEAVVFDVHQARFVDRRGEVIGTVGSARDITERKRGEAFVQHLAHYDVLTDLPNRALLHDRLSQALTQARRDRAKLAVLFVDLDRLKPVNDTYGHDIGDLLLIEVASRLRSAVTRKTDTVARLGGDEFVILLPRINREHDAAVVAQRVLDVLSRPFAIDDRAIAISASIGVAVSPQDGEEAEILLKSADGAMYGAKRAGRNGFQFCGPTHPATPDEPPV